MDAHMCVSVCVCLYVSVHVCKCVCVFVCESLYFLESTHVCACLVDGPFFETTYCH